MTHTRYNSSQSQNRNQKGFVLILALVVMAAVSAGLVTALLSSSVGGYKVAALEEGSAQARGAADACAEIALQKLVASAAFTGSGAATVGLASCSYTVALNGSLDAISATGTTTSSVRKTKVILYNPTLVIASWQEVGDF